MALIGFMAIGATLHCGSSADDTGGSALTGSDAGTTTLSGSCESGSTNQAGCACAQGETLACYTGPASTRGVGTCKDGTQVCTAGSLSVRSLHLDALGTEAVTDGYGYGPCTGEVLPTTTATCEAASSSGGTGTGADGGGSSDPGVPGVPGVPGTTTPSVTCPGALTRWVPMSTVGAPPSLVEGPELVWTGTEVVVFSGRDDNDETVDGGWLYNPKTDSWRQMSATGRPASRAAASSLWNGSRFIVWGGEHDTNGGSSAVNLDDGGIYDPTTDTWEAIPSPSTLGIASGPGAGRRQLGWTGTELVIFGGDAGSTDGWFYAPSTKTFRAFGGGLGVSGPHLAGTPSIDLWTGTAAVMWGETMNPGTTALLASFTEAGGLWKQGAAAPLSAREGADSVLAGTQIFVHGGRALVPPYAVASDGAMYDPSADSWTPIPDGGGTRVLGTTLWTGCDAIEIGGIGDDAATSATRYTPATRTWTTLPTLPARFINAPWGAVWAGDQLIGFGDGGNNVGDMFAYRLVQE